MIIGHLRKQILSAGHWDSVLRQQQRRQHIMARVWERWVVEFNYYNNWLCKSHVIVLRITLLDKKEMFATEPRSFDLPSFLPLLWAQRDDKHQFLFKWVVGSLQATLRILQRFAQISLQLHSLARVRVLLEWMFVPKQQYHDWARD